MKHLFIACAYGAITFCTVSAELPEIRLWPDGMPEPVVPADPPEQAETGLDGLTRRSNVSQPRLFVHEPPRLALTSDRLAQTARLRSGFMNRELMRSNSR